MDTSTVATFDYLFIYLLKVYGIYYCDLSILWNNLYQLCIWTTGCTDSCTVGGGGDNVDNGHDDDDDEVHASATF